VWIMKQPHAGSRAEVGILLLMLVQSMLSIIIEHDPVLKDHFDLCQQFQLYHIKALLASLSEAF